MLLVISICPLAIYNSCEALFRAMNDSKTTMLIAIAMNLINLVGNAILIYGVKIGVCGRLLPRLFQELRQQRVSGGMWFLRFSCGCRPFILPNTLWAAGDVVWTMFIAIGPMWIFRIGFAYFFSYCFHGGLLDVWIAMTIDWAFRAICYEIRCHGHKWEKLR